MEQLDQSPVRRETADDIAWWIANVIGSFAGAAVLVGLLLLMDVELDWWVYGFTVAWVSITSSAVERRAARR